MYTRSPTAPAGLPGLDRVLGQPAYSEAQTVAQLRREIEMLRQQLAEVTDQLLWIKSQDETLRGTLAQVRQVLANGKLQAIRSTAIALAFEISSRQNKPERDGYWRINLSQLAKLAGNSEPTAGRHVKKLAELGIIDRKLTTADNLKPGEYRRWVMVRPAGPDLNDVLAPLARAEVPPDRRHGGRRRCPNECGAPLVKRTVIACSGCGEIIDESSGVISHGEPSPAKDPD